MPFFSINSNLLSIAFSSIKFQLINYLHQENFFENCILINTCRRSSGTREQRDRLHVPWDNSVNKNAVIYADHTTLDVRNMPLTG